jgi:3-oxoacyl-[acyl-carrier protein] reductase
VGEQVALTLAGAGAQVSLLDIRDTSSAVAAVTAAGGKAQGFRVDVTDRAAVHATMEQAAATAGGIDVLVSNAGVNAIAPGAIETDMIAGKGYTGEYCPMGRLGQPQEIASIVHFLATSASSYMTGAVLDANGGFHFS